VKTTLALAHLPTAASEEIPAMFTKERLRPASSGRFVIHSCWGWPSGPVTWGGAATLQPAEAAGRAYHRCA
jgi:hypothetical protein